LNGIAFAAWIASTMVFVEPLQAIMLNWDELATDLPTMLWRLAPIALFVFAGLAPLAFATCWLAPTRGLALWSALSVAIWLQADIFVWHYGSFDGTPLDWSAHEGKAWFATAAWLGAPALALWRPAWPASHALRILLGIVALQAAGLVGAAMENAPFAEKRPLSTLAPPTAREFATLSSRGNVIIVVLDALQSDFFADAMHSNDLAARIPGGFVYYRNAVSLYTTTQFSLQSILTSRAVPDGKDALGWRAGVMAQSLPAVLAARGFDSQLATFSRASIACGQPILGLACARLAALRSSGTATGLDSQWRADVSLMLRLGFFRVAPHWLKPYVYDSGEWGVPAAYPIRKRSVDIHDANLTDLEVLDNLAASVQAKDVAPRFRFLHLNGSHIPTTIDARCEAVAIGNTRERAVATTGCMLRKLYQFFDALDDAGVYDDALILVVADHGYPKLPPDPELAKPPLPGPSARDGTSLSDWSRGIPLFLAKLPGARGPLQTSDRAVSLCDVPATVMDVLHIEAVGRFHCESVLGLRRGSPRMHYRYPGVEEQRKRPRPDRNRFQFERIRVEGHSWYPGSWVQEP
jgi:hypothetical protein